MTWITSGEAFWGRQPGMPRRMGPRKMTYRRRFRGKPIGRGGFGGASKSKALWSTNRQRKMTSSMPSIFRGVSNMPSELTYFTYRNRVTLTSGTTSLYGTAVTLNLNSLYSPVTGVTLQPYGYDQAAEIYFKYKVLSNRIRLVFTRPSNAGICVAIALQSPNDGGTISGFTTTQVADNWNNTNIMLPNTGDQEAVFAPPPYSIATVAGITKMQHRADVSQYSASFGASPTLIPKVLIASADTTSGGSAICDVWIELEMCTLLWDRKSISQSYA